MSKMKVLDWVAISLLLIGGLNWGLIGFAGYDLVSIIFGQMTFLSRAVYGLVGLSALYSFFSLFKLINK